MPGKGKVHEPGTNGVAPGQPFLVGLGPPEVVESGWEVTEYDEYWDGELIEVRPLPAAVVLKRWEEDARRLAKWKAVAEAESTSNRYGTIASAAHWFTVRGSTASAASSRV